MRFLVRWLITAIAVAVAVLAVPGIEVSGQSVWVSIVFGALVVGLLNATLGVVLKIGTFGCIVMTFGLFTLVINAGVLMLASWISQNWFNLGFHVDGFWPALIGGIVISLVTSVLTWFLNGGTKDRPLRSGV